MRTKRINHAAISSRSGGGGNLRRDFLQAGAVAAPFGPNAFLRVAPDSTITVMINRLGCRIGAPVSRCVGLAVF